MTKRKNNRQKMETYKEILTKVVKRANINPMEYLKRVKQDQDKENYTRPDHERVEK